MKINKHICLFITYDIISIAWTIIIFTLFRMGWYENLPPKEQTNNNYAKLYIGTLICRTVVNRIIKVISEPLCK
mgnify:CR=1